jgi:hypothetical protein
LALARKCSQLSLEASSLRGSTLQLVGKLGEIGSRFNSGHQGGDFPIQIRDPCPESLAGQRVRRRVLMRL